MLTLEIYENFAKLLDSFDVGYQRTDDHSVYSAQHAKRNTLIGLILKHPELQEMYSAKVDLYLNRDENLKDQLYAKKLEAFERVRKLTVQV